MHIERITFTRVFSVFRKQSKKGLWTEFGFEAGSKKVYSARVQGHHPVPEGTPIAVAMPKENAWTNIYGWVNLRTGQVFVEEESSSVLIGLGAIALIFYLLFSPLILASWQSDGTKDRILAILVLSVPLIALVHSITKSMRTNSARRLLAEYAANTRVI